MIQIKTEADYRAALKEIESLMMADPDKTPIEGEKLATMVTLIEAYEAKHFPMQPDNLRPITWDEAEKIVGRMFFKMKLLKIIYDLADRIDIWFTKHWNIRAKQRALEAKMDHFPDKKIESAITEALSITANNEPKSARVSNKE